MEESEEKIRWGTVASESSEFKAYVIDTIRPCGQSECTEKERFPHVLFFAQANK